ncbi:hypothetical protein [Dongia rigui]|uniref:Uncharacterized protein n=1 Tax=Dongia rigui TaxID=940149 RepID=A0ABU5E021_9PROT|nr:hypothetical protein [Dongia rigui]MDY0872937.1 hypothetical protein [Dongia rigui]
MDVTFDGMFEKVPEESRRGRVKTVLLGDGRNFHRIARQNIRWRRTQCLCRGGNSLTLC